MGSAFCYIIDQFLHYGFLLHLFCYIMGHFASLLHYGFLLHYRLLQGIQEMYMCTCVYDVNQKTIESTSAPCSLMHSTSFQAKH